MQRRPKNKQPEQELYKALARYFAFQHPKLLWRFDFAAGTKMTMGQVARHKMLNPHRGWPDLIIFEQRKGWGALVIEIKAEGNSPYKKDFELKKDVHLEAQAAMLERFSALGYYAAFATGFDECVAMIEKYLKLEK
jgi:hypothetical protein